MKLTLLPSKRTIEFDPPMPLRNIVDIPIEYPCGANGKCGKCLVRFVNAPPQPTPRETDTISPDMLRLGWRLACETVLLQDATIEVQEINNISAPEKTPATTNEINAGIAIDIGSTSLCAVIADLKTEKVLAAMTMLNMQTLIGADVMSRVAFATSNKNGNDILHKTLIEEINCICENLCERAKINTNNVTTTTVVGNPIMLHSFVGESICSFGQAPYEGIWTELKSVKAQKVGLTAIAMATLHILPQIQHIVGADTTAAILATDMDTRRGTSLLIDLGTNSEIVLANDGAIRATSTAAGPAFEGINISCGMRATPGAIDRVFVNDDGAIDISVIGDTQPVGICGTGLVDAIAMLLDMGAVTEAGRLLPPDKSPVPNIIDIDEKTTKPRAKLTDKVFITAEDIRQLQLVKGAVRAGAQILLDDAGITWTDINRIFLAGAFGQALNRNSIARIALLPQSVIPITRPIGNAAGTGALKALLAWDRMIPRLNNIHKSSKYIDCTINKNFEDNFAAAMSFAEEQ